jgi:TRAP-type C4-dicarboxylate transport system permease large subunit
VLLETVRISAFLLFIVIGASVLSFVFDYLRLPTLLVEAVKAAELSPGIVLLAIAVPYVILGMFVDPISMMVMTLPVLFPLVVAMGFDPVWFGIILVLLVEIGLIFPPIGMNLSVLRSIGGDAVTLRQIVLGSLPFMAVMAAFIWLLYFVPGLVTWLPRTMS